MALWPNSVFAMPVSSFERPVPVPGTDPLSGDCAIIRVNQAWLPYITGALQQLLLETTWDTDAAGLELVQMQASTLILSLANAQPGGCGQDDFIPPIQESEYIMSICEQLRWQDGILQGLCCGEWVDIPGQGQGNQVPGQPGAGAPLPDAGGGTADYCFTQDGDQARLLPPIVNSGDTLLFHDLRGAWNDRREVIWNCPDGWVYALGACGQTLPHGSPDPLPTALHMQILAVINGNYYDPLAIDIISGHPTLWTVPGGISDAAVTFIPNIDDIAQGQGQVSYCVTVTNQATRAWSHFFDFTQSPYGQFFTGHPGTNGQPRAIWVAGSGYTFNPGTGDSNPTSLIQFDATNPVTTEFDTETFKLSAALVAGGFWQWFPDGVVDQTVVSIGGADQETINSPHAGGAFFIGIDTRDGSDAPLIRSFTMTGRGTDPFPGAPTP